MSRSREDINQKERDIWNEKSLDRRKIKKLRRHAFHFTYIREQRDLDKLLTVVHGKNILEIGSYTWTSWLIKGNHQPAKLTCINISEAELDLGKAKAAEQLYPVEHHLMDANNLTFEDESFDVVFGSGILHHLDIEATMAHIHRVLKPGGKIVFMEPMNMNPLYKIYRKMNPQERTPDEHALVGNDFKIIREKFTFDHYFYDFFTVIFGFIALKIYGDKNYDNWLNKIGSRLDIIFAKIPFMYPFFARVTIFGTKK